jgi:hypothetical protein
VNEQQENLQCTSNSHHDKKPLIRNCHFGSRSKITGSMSTVLSRDTQYVSASVQAHLHAVPVGLGQPLCCAAAGRGGGGGTAGAPAAAPAAGAPPGPAARTEAPAGCARAPSPAEAPQRSSAPSASPLTAGPAACPLQQHSATSRSFCSLHVFCDDSMAFDGKYSCELLMAAATGLLVIA